MTYITEQLANQNRQFYYQKWARAGTVVVRAEALVGEAAALRVTLEDSEGLTLSAGSPPGSNSIYLPLISNNTGQAE